LILGFIVPLIAAIAYPVLASADLATTVQFDIKAQRLPSALIQYSQQSGVQVTAAASLLVGLRSTGVKGALPASQALGQLLMGTGIDYAVVDSNTVSLHSAAGAAHGGSTEDTAVAPISTASTTDSSQPEALAEVIVTAQKRSEDILAVPISITAVSGSVLEQQEVKTIDDLSRLVPGMSLIPSGAASTGNPQSEGERTVVIRGIGATAGAATTGIYIDDTPIQGREEGTVFPDVFDLARVEVLRGPQGTLFGAGSEGGTVRFITPTPSLTNYSAYAHSELAFTERGTPSFEAGVAAGGPVVDNTVGIRASIWSRYDGGYIDRYNFFTNDLTAQNTNTTQSYVGRVMVLVKPTDNLTITPAIYFQRIDRADSDAWWSTKGVYESYYNIPQPTLEQFYLPSLSLEYQLSGFSVKSITSYFSRVQQGVNEFFHSSKQDLFYAAVPNYALNDVVNRGQDNFTQEFRLTSSDDGRLTWVAGAFYMNNAESYHEDEIEPLANQLWLAVTGYNIDQFFGVPQINGDDSYSDRRHVYEKELAVFGDATLKITDRFKLTAGVRNSHTSFSFNETSAGPFGVGANLLPLSTSGGSTEHPTTPKVGASYDLPHGLLYASVAEGYRIGGANQLLPNICTAQLESLGVKGSAPPYTSDKVVSYEVGAKDRLADGRILLSSSVYKIDWSRIQSIIPLNSCAYTYTANFGTAVSKGFDVQGIFAPFKGVEISTTVSYTKAYYSESVSVPGDAGLLLTKDGDPLLFTPKWQGNLGLSYTWDPVAGFHTYIRSDASYSGNYYRTYSPGVNGYLGSIRDGQSITQVSLRAGLKKDNWETSLFVQNLTGNSTPLYEDVGTVPGTYGYSAIRAISLRPRTVGVALSYHY
jgi:outer membrane receptor protein involved in Fe transport